MSVDFSLIKLGRLTDNYSLYKLLLLLLLIIYIRE